jgi:hypothetical protein
MWTGNEFVSLKSERVSIFDLLFFFSLVTNKREKIVPFVGVVDAFEGDVLVVVKRSIELGVVAVVPKFGVQKVDIGPNQRCIA